MENNASVFGLIGSSRRNGNTALLADAVFRRLENARLYDLNDYVVGPYDYGNHHDADDFLPLARRMADADAIVFASPVYWYSMSAQMKAFFDRLTDLTEPYKPIGKSLAGKTVFAISTGGGDAPPVSFVDPISDTARYFNMRWGGVLHAPFNEDMRLTPDADEAAAAFAECIAQRINAPAPMRET